MPWTLHVARSAEKELEGVPERDRTRILKALKNMSEDPFAGDVARLHGLPTAWRRRAGNWRILYDLYPDRGLIVVASIRRRTSTTY
jgi:mRNA-degrading endonuclease RelE of RelBE toxin-antitoxin system